MLSCPDTQQHPPPDRQWSWPINLPPQLFGIFPTAELGHDDTTTPWADELEQKVLQSTVGIGPYVEVAFFDKRSKTVLVTDAVVCVPENPPPVRLTEEFEDIGKRELEGTTHAVASV